MHRHDSRDLMPSRESKLLEWIVAIMKRGERGLDEARGRDDERMQACLTSKLAAYDLARMHAAFKSNQPK